MNQNDTREELIQKVEKYRLVKQEAIWHRMANPYDTDASDEAHFAALDYSIAVKALKDFENKIIYSVFNTNLDRFDNPSLSFSSPITTKEMCDYLNGNLGTTVFVPRATTWDELNAIAKEKREEEKAAYISDFVNILDNVVKEKEMDNLDTWGVWDTREKSWLESYYDANSRWHNRQYINQRHAQNVANQLNGFLDTRYEARDMRLEKSSWEDDAPNVGVAAIRTLIADKQGTIYHLEQEINALKMTLMLLGVHDDNQ